ncbi:MAG TPA: GGDEF domain-containing protein [Isosphaeraceae bacterium]|nr:GGDEF domain-containing protein [Isosphaeraceae bacterium]
MPDQPTISHLAKKRAVEPRGLATLTQTISGWSAVAASLLGSALESLGANLRGDGPLHEFADFLAHADDPAAIQVALVRLAQRLSRSARVVLLRVETPGRTAEPVAVWPIPVANARPMRAETLGVTLRLGVELHGHRWGELQFAGGRSRWPARLVRRLTTLATIAAAAERAARARRPAGLPTPFDAATGLYNEPFLKALLEHAVRQARRRKEPLTLLCLGIAPADTSGERPRPRLTDSVMQVLARAVVASLRLSDVLARLDAGHLAAILPGTAPGHHRTIASVLRRAIAEAAHATANPGPLEISLGFACYPADGETAESLLAAASLSLERTRTEPALAALASSRSEPLPA